MIKARVRNAGSGPAFYTEVNIDGTRRTFYATDNGFWLAPGEERLLDIHVWWREPETRSQAALTLGAWNARAAAGDDRESQVALPLYSSQQMTTHLDTILAATRAAVAADKARVPAVEVERLAAAHQPRGWAAALRRRAAAGPAIIAEIKKASPSKGLIRAEFDAAWLAARYQAGGAAALSVLTDEPFFQGSLRNLELVSAAASLPCLRKDFTVDEYQIAEARAHCADAILLIAAALSGEQMKRFAAAARALALDVLVEVHTGGELDRVLDTLGETGADAIGVNSRDLKTFEVRLDTCSSWWTDTGERGTRGRERDRDRQGYGPAARGRL